MLMYKLKNETSTSLVFYWWKIFILKQNNMKKNVLSIGLLRNGTVYEDRNAAKNGLTMSESKDGAIKLARYLKMIDGNQAIKTLIGFYANADEMEDNGNGQSSYTVIDLDEFNEKIALESNRAIEVEGELNDSLINHVTNSNIHVSENDKAKWDSKAEVSDIPDVSNFIDGVEYEKQGDLMSIVFYHGNTYVDSIDATPFIKDGMIDDVRIENGYLVIDFNTESGKQDISIPLTDIFDQEAYYTKEDVNALLQEKEDEIYSLKKIVGDLGGDVVYDLPNEGKTFNTLMNNNGTVKLSDDVTTSRFGPGVMAKNEVKLNLNNHNLTITGASTSSAIQARGSQIITISGKGTINSVDAIAVMCNSANAVINLSGTTATTYTTYRPQAELIYCYSGTINISNGTFKNEGSPYLLNCYDTNYKNGTAKIIVTGGRFYDFNPADNNAEGEHTSFVAEGYHVDESTVIEDDVEHTVYTVKKD